MHLYFLCLSTTLAQVSAFRLNRDTFAERTAEELRHDAMAILQGNMVLTEKDQAWLSGRNLAEEINESAMKQVMDAGYEVLEGKTTSSPYSSFDWDGLSFADRWKQFRIAVPLKELQSHKDPSIDDGPVCLPSLMGNPRSNKLAILVHGFTACPDALHVQAKMMLDAGFQVLRPTLPGHGRKAKKKRTLVCNVQEGAKLDDRCIQYMAESIDEKGKSVACNWTAQLSCPGQSEGTSGEARENSSVAYQCCCKEELWKLDHLESLCPDSVEQDYTDDLSQFPKEPAPYLHMAEALGKLAEQFKEENPGGLVVMLGHSLGGMVSAKTAMERPHVIDRLMLLSPMFGLSSSLLRPLVKLGSSVRINTVVLGDPECDSRRSTQGGICQFQLANVGAMSDLAYLVLCRQWGVEEACLFAAGSSLALLSGAGVGTTAGLAAGGAAAAAIAAGATIAAAHGAVASLITSGAIAGMAAGQVHAIAMAGAAAATVTFPVPVIIMIILAVIGVTVITGLVVNGISNEVIKRLSKLAILNETRSLELRQTWGELKQVQVVKAVSDPAVDNNKVTRFAVEVMLRRSIAQKTLIEDRSDGQGYCQWPKVVGHNYNNNRNKKPGKWFQNYIEGAMVAFLAKGRFIDAVVRPDHSVMLGSGVMCFENQEQISGTSLTVLPATQRSALRLGGYSVSRESNWTEGANDSLVKSLFQGRVEKKQTFGWFTSRWHKIEVLDPHYKGQLLIALRSHFNSDINKLFVARQPIRLGSSGSKKCIMPTMASIEPRKPLFTELDAIQDNFYDHSLWKYNMDFCKDRLVNIMCTFWDCNNPDREPAPVGQPGIATEVAGEPWEGVQILGTTRPNIKLVNELDEPVTFKSKLGSSTTVPPHETAEVDWAFNMVFFWNNPSAEVLWETSSARGSVKDVFANQTVTIGYEEPSQLQVVEQNWSDV